MTRGHAAPEVEATYARLLELSDRTGKPPQDIYFGLWHIYVSRGELRRARELARQRIQAAEAAQDLESLVLGLYTGRMGDAGPRGGSGTARRTDLRSS